MTGIPAFADITDEVQAVVAESGVEQGLVSLFTADETAAIVVNERESGLLADMENAVARLSATSGAPRIGLRSVVFPAVRGVLYLGGWQRVMLVGLAGEGPKQIVVQVTGE